MKVLILGHGLRGVGAVSVGCNLIPALARSAPDLTLHVTFPDLPGFHRTWSQNRHLTNLHPIPYQGSYRLLRRWWWEHTVLPDIIKSVNPDLIFSMADRGLLNPPCPQAILVHRSQLFYPPSNYPGESLKNRLLFRYHAHHLKRALNRTDLLLCQTRTAQQRLIDRYGFPGPCALLPNGLSHRLVLPADGPGPEEPIELKPYRGWFKLFFLSRYYAHKNLESLIPLSNLIHRLDENRKILIITTISPQDHPRAARLLKKLDQINGQPQEAGGRMKVLNTGPIPQEALDRWLTHSDALLFPTLLESFSATYLEAMAYNLPIITSDLDFARETCGDGAYYVDPWSGESILRGITALADSPHLGRELAQKGREQLARFDSSWDQIATRAAEELRKVIKGGQTDRHRKGKKNRGGEDGGTG